MVQKYSWSEISSLVWTSRTLNQIKSLSWEKSCRVDTEFIRTHLQTHSQMHKICNNSVGQRGKWWQKPGHIIIMRRANISFLWLIFLAIHMKIVRDPIIEIAPPQVLSLWKFTKTQIHYILLQVLLYLGRKGKLTKIISLHALNS